MITAVDTSVLLDVFTADATYGLRSRDALRRCRDEGRLVACDVVFAELAGSFPTAADAETALGQLEIHFVPLTALASLRAGSAWRAYRKAGGSRERLVADFLIGAHASSEAARLLTRDRGFYRTYFAALPIVDAGDA